MSIASAQSLEGSMNQRSGTNGQIFVGNIAGPPGPPGAPGSPGPQGPKGDTYVLTDTDKLVIADIVLHSGLLDGTPVFDLTGHMAPIPLAGIAIGTARMDTTEIRAGLDKGPVAFVMPFDMDGMTITAKIVINAASVGDAYQSVIVVNYVAPGVLIVNVDTSGISINSMPINEVVGLPTPTEDDNGKFMKVVDGVLVFADKDPAPTSIDLSNLETLGTIVETFANGSVAVTFLEFDSDGRPTKITDRNGDVTVLTW